MLVVLFHRNKSILILTGLGNPTPPPPSNGMGVKTANTRVPLRFELGSSVSESKVLIITPQDLGEYLITLILTESEVCTGNIKLSSCCIEQAIPWSVRE